jgi:hypothetical protein
LYRPIFTIPVFIATALLILHSALFRGRRDTLLFWGLGYLVAFGRELVYQNVFPTYRFTGADLKLLNVPLTVPAGWLFEAYTSLYVAQFLLGVDRASLTKGLDRMTPKAYGERVLPVITLSCVVTATIACAIENVAVRMRWWQTRGGGESISPGWIPGHMFTVFWLLTLLLAVTHRGLRLGRNLLHVALALGFLGVVELIDVIVPASQDRPWVTAAAMVVCAAYLASLFMWRRLVLFFVVDFVLGVMGDNVASVIASAIGRPADMLLVWQIWTMTVMVTYGVYIVTRQRPAVQVRPAELL